MDGADTLTARVISVTEDIIVAGVCIVDVEATGSGITTVIGTHIIIVAVKGRTAYTGTGRAGVNGGTDITVIAGVSIVGVDTAGSGITGVIGTDITVIAVRG